MYMAQTLRATAGSIFMNFYQSAILVYIVCMSQAFSKQRHLATNVVFTRRYRPADGPGLCPVLIDVSGVCPLYVRGMSDACPPDSDSRTQRRTVRRTVRRTEGGAIITRDVMTYIVMT